MPQSIKTKKDVLLDEVVLSGKKVPSLGKVHLARLSVMTLLILPVPPGFGGKIIKVNDKLQAVKIIYSGTQAFYIIVIITVSERLLLKQY